MQGHTAESLTYLDNAATSWPKPPAVAEAMSRFLAESAGNPGRGGHALARAAVEPVEDVRERLAAMVGSPCPNRVVMTHGCTDSVNLAIHGVLRGVLRKCPGKKPRVVTTVAEHNAVTRTIGCYAESGEIELEVVTCDGRGWVDPETFLAACTPCTVLACMTHASNAAGTIQPVGEIGRRLRERSPEALFLVDAAQTVGHMAVDVMADEIDLLAMAGHKGLLGPTGTGGLYVGPRAFPAPGEDDAEATRLFCQRRGGTGAVAAGLHMPTVLPDALEAGTVNAVGFAGMLAGMTSRVSAWHENEMTRTREIMAGLKAIPGVTLHGPPADAPRTPVVLFSVDGACPRDVGAAMDKRFGVCVRGGTHCAPLLHEAIGTGSAGAVRASPGWATTADDVARLIAGIEMLAHERRLAHV